MDDLQFWWLVAQTFQCNLHEHMWDRCACCRMFPFPSSPSLKLCDMEIYAKRCRTNGNWQYLMEKRSGRYTWLEPLARYLRCPQSNDFVWFTPSKTPLLLKPLQSLYWKRRIFSLERFVLTPHRSLAPILWRNSPESKTSPAYISCTHWKRIFSIFGYIHSIFTLFVAVGIMFIVILVSFIFK